MNKAGFTSQRADTGALVGCPSQSTMLGLSRRPLGGTGKLALWASIYELYAGPASCKHVTIAASRKSWTGALTVLDLSAASS